MKTPEFDEMKRNPSVSEIVINSRNIQLLTSPLYFNGNSALYRTGELRTIELNKFIGRKQNRDILPINTRYSSVNNKGEHIIVIEEQPCIRTIKVNMPLLSEAENLKSAGKLEKYGFEEFLKTQANPPYNVTLSFPYIIYVFRLNSLGVNEFKVFFRLHPLSSLDDYLIRPFLPNMDNSEVCTGSITIASDDFKSLSTVVDSYITAWWEYEFNTDLIGNYNSYIEKGPPELNGYLTWAYYTQYDPLFIFGIDWIMYDYKLSSIIDRAHQEQSDTSSEDTYRKFITDLTKTQEDSTINSCTYSDYITVNNKILSVGDEVVINEKLQYVYSIETSRRNGTHTSVTFIDDNDDIMTLAWNSDLINKLDEYLNKPEDSSYTTSEGEVIRKEDIVAVNISNPIYSGVQYRVFGGLRKTRDGSIEIKLGGIYFLESTIQIKTVDLSNASIDGIPLIEKDKYIILNKHKNFNPVHRVTIATFNTVQLSDNKIIAKFSFRDSDGDRRNRSLSMDGQSKFKLVDISKTTTPPLYRQGFNIYTQSEGMERMYVLDEQTPLLIDNAKGLYFEYRIVRKYIDDNPGMLSISGYGGNIDLKVGDDVVVANWENPYEMTIIQTITKIDYTRHYARVHTVDSQNVTRGYDYIDFETGFINVGLIRKVSKTYKNLAVGMKLIAKEPRVAMFPKKDVNKIIAFIKDTKAEYPLILCSNLCTLWGDPETLSKFEFIGPFSPKYIKHKITPYSINKIKSQPGDFYTRDNNYELHSLLTEGSYSTSIKHSPGFKHYNERPKEYEKKSPSKRFGFLTPRIPASKLMDMPRTAKIPTIFGSSTHPDSEMSAISHIISYRGYNIPFQSADAIEEVCNPESIETPNTNETEILTDENSSEVIINSEETEIPEPETPNNEDEVIAETETTELETQVDANANTNIDDIDSDDDFDLRDDDTDDIDSDDEGNEEN